MSVCLSVCLSVCCCGHSNLVVLIRFHSNFYIWISSIKLSFKFEYRFCSTNNNQDCQQYGRRHQCLMLWSLLLSHVCRISSKFHIWIAFIKLLAKMDANMAYTCKHSNLVFHHPISSKFHIWTTFIKLLFMSECEFWPMNDNQDGIQI